VPGLIKWALNETAAPVYVPSHTNATERRLLLDKADFLDAVDDEHRAGRELLWGTPWQDCGPKGSCLGSYDTQSVNINVGKVG